MWSLHETLLVPPESAQALREARMRAGLSLERVAEASGIPSARIAALEAGTTSGLEDPMLLLTAIERVATCIGLRSGVTVEETLLAWSSAYRRECRKGSKRRSVLTDMPTAPWRAVTGTVEEPSADERLEGTRRKAVRRRGSRGHRPRAARAREDASPQHGAEADGPNAERPGANGPGAGGFGADGARVDRDRSSAARPGADRSSAAGPSADDAGADGRGAVRGRERLPGTRPRVLVGALWLTATALVASSATLGAAHAGILPPARGKANGGTGSAAPAPARSGPLLRQVMAGPQQASYQVATSNYQLTVISSRPSWVRVSAGEGSVVYAGVVGAGETRTFSGSGAVAVEVGAGGTVLSVSSEGRSQTLSPPAAPYTYKLATP